MEFKKRKLVLKIDDKEYSLKYPTVRVLMDFQKEYKKEDKDELGLTVKFLSDLGLPESETMDLEGEQLQNLLEALSGQKKS